MTQFKNELVQKPSGKEYGGVSTSVTTAQSVIDHSVSLQDLTVTPKRTLDQEKELVYIKGVLTNRTKIDGFYVVVDVMKNQSTNEKKLFESIHNSHTIVVSKNETYVVKKPYSEVDLETIHSDNKQLFARTSGVRENFDYITYAISTSWLVEQFGLEAEYISTTI